jgi:hypothetical protein
MAGKISQKTLEKIPRFIELIKSGIILKQACLELKLDHRMALKILEKHNLMDFHRTRNESAADKRLSLEEANRRLPEGHGIIIKYDENFKAYIIQRNDGSTYKRITSQIFRGDPEKSSKKQITLEEAQKRLLELGYELITETFINSRTPLEAKHIQCGYIRRNNLFNYKTQGCPRCNNNGNSDQERSLDNWVRSFGFQTKKFLFPKDCKGPGKGKEIDIFIPELNLGIEFCGLMYHGEYNKKRQVDGKIKFHTAKGRKYIETDYDNPKKSHKIKLDKANSIGINLITLFSNEWNNSVGKVKSILRSRLGKNEIKIGARETEIKQISTSIANEFLNKYHLQGGSKQIISFGLFYNNELVAVITGNHHHRIKGKFVLNRLCFKTNTTVIGGASKLNSALEKWAKNAAYEDIVSWSDNRWSNGSVYKALGYFLENELPPDYFYFDNRGNTYSKQSCQKKHLLKKGAIGNTEWEMAQSLGYDRIWDCGKKTWVKKLI